ncbi:MAG: hypothetical protein ACI9U2_002750 [Bradymonadia bacterium]|jgi:hypothetical protein
MRSLLAAAAVIACASPAAAASLGDAQVFVNAASQAFRKGEYQIALVALRKAEPIVEKANDPTLAPIRFNIARCLEELGKPAEALGAYARYLNLPDQSGRKSRAQAAVKALKRKVFGGVAISCDPEGAMITIAGLIDQPAACPLRKAEIEPGTYTVQVEFEGYTSQTREIEVAVGEPRAVTVSLTREGGLTMPSMEADAPTDPLPWVLTGGGALAVVGGLALTFAAIGARDDAEGMQPGSARDGRVDDFDRNETLSWVAFGFGGVSLLTGVILLTMDEDESATTGWQMTGNGVMVRW